VINTESLNDLDQAELLELYADLKYSEFTQKRQEDDLEEAINKQKLSVLNTHLDP
jgi:hypothetical protein